MKTPGSLAIRIWRDGAVRSLPVWLLITVALTNALGAILVLRAISGAAPVVPTYQLILLLWLPVGIYLLFGRTRARCHQLDLALPIPASQLWLAHFLAVALAAATLLAAACGVLAANRRLLSRLSGAEIGVELLPLLLPLTAALLFAVLLAHRLQPGSWKLTGGLHYWTVQIGGQASILAILLLLSSRPRISTALLLVAAAMLAADAWSSLPATFAIAPLDGGARERGTSDAAPPALSRDPVGNLTILRILFTVLHNAPPWRRLMPAVLYCFVLLMGFFLSGVLALWLDGDDARLMNLSLGSYVLFTGAGLLTHHLHRLDHLPIPRRTLFRVLTLPTLLAFCLGWAGGRLLLATADPRALVRFQIHETEQGVEVDPAHMGFTWGGKPPPLAAPWGETHEAWRQPLFRGAATTLYSPFDTPEPSSARFEALMISRAIERVYGEVIPYTEILDRYLETEGDALVGIADGGLTLLADYPALAAPAEGPGTPVYLAMALLPWLLLLAIFARSFRATSSVRLIRWVYWAGLMALLGVLFGQIVLAYVAGYSPTAAQSMLEIFVHRLGSHPLGPPAVWGVVLAAVFLAYRMAQAQFLRSELPTTPIQCALIDWGRDD